MDIKNNEWFGQAIVSGVGKPISLQGSVLSMTGEILAQLRSLTPRELQDGKKIQITFSTTPIGQERAKNDQLALVASISESVAGAVSDNETPLENEDIDSYIIRLIASGHSPAGAKFLADDWYELGGGESQDRLRLWLEDEKAVRFRHLNSSGSAFEAAHPTEYRQLVDDMRERFPEFIEHLQLRIAI